MKNLVKIGDYYFDTECIVAFKPIYVSKEGRVDIQYISVHIATGDIINVICEDAEGNWGREIYEKYAATLVAGCSFAKSNLICENKTDRNETCIV